jgi:CMP-N,N'-diacetyllegionaminic acid synthase
MEHCQAKALSGYCQGQISMSDTIIAIITARGGSKGLPGKNIRMLSGKPLIAYSILAAQQCTHIARSIVTTEDPEIKRVSIQWGAEVIDRPPELSADTSLSQDAVRHTLETLDKKEGLPEYFVLLQPTSPLRNAVHLQECLNSFINSDYASAISVTEMEHHPYKCLLVKNGKLSPFHNIESLDKPRQLLPKAYRQNGAIYALRTKEFLKHNSFFVPPAMPYYMNQQDSIDIDTENDFLLATQIIAKLNSNNTKNGTCQKKTI